ncbi:hypothetical protein HYFRA_00011633 [Hymenoscyphus fraxineus]|uniref:Mid2 domain-containing protein n=1 Tax=Hymenoscyphus fraxineus TaxID=746836 RepID=A0A9N9KYD3_9HELO|nr:hypothetical protein HYFRA_00011633 [Hymenoscyphus fraxineus]
MAGHQNQITYHVTKLEQQLPHVAILWIHAQAQDIVWEDPDGCTVEVAWESPNCAKQQSACVANPITKRAFNSWNPLWSCNQPGTPASDFCCGYDSTSCCNSSFVLGTTGSAFKPGVDAFVANLTSGNTTPTPIANANAIANTSANTSTPDAAKSSDNTELGTKVGLGVGIPLGILVLGLLALLFWRERSKRSYKDIDTSMNSVNNNVSGAMAGQYMHNDQEQRQNSYQSNGSMAGAGSVYQQQVSPAQTYQSPVQKIDQYSFAPTYEAPANTAPQELSTSR